MKLSGIIIAKNEESMIADAIDSLSFCDEVIVIDNESQDRTVDIAKHAGAKVFATKAQSFAEKRNVGKEKAKGEWILYLDADERVTKELAASIKTAITDASNIAYRVSRQNYYLGNNPWPQVESLERLFKKENLIEWYGDLHESPKVKGSIGNLSGMLNHYTHRDLTSMLAKTIQWSEKEAKLRYDAHHPEVVWWRFPRVMITAFMDSYVKQKGYKAGVVGVIESMFQSFSMFITYARLWEMQQK